MPIHAPAHRPVKSRVRKLAVERLDRRDLLAGLSSSFPNAVALASLNDYATNSMPAAEGEASVMGLYFRAEDLNGQPLDPNNIAPNSIFNLVVQAQDLRTTPSGVYAIDEDVLISNPNVVEVAMGELQVLRFPQAFSSGTFTLNFNGQTTAAIVPPTSLIDPAAVNAAATRITTALTPILGGANFQVVVNDDAGPAEFIIHFRGQYLLSDVPAIVGNFSQVAGTTLTENYTPPLSVRSEVLNQHITYLTPYKSIKASQFTSETGEAFIVASFSNSITFPTNPELRRSILSIPMHAKAVGTTSITGTPGTGNRQNLLYGVSQPVPIDAIDSIPLSLRVVAPRTNLGTLQGITEVNGLSLQPNEGADWFQFTTVEAGNSVHGATLQFTHTQGDLELELYDSADRLLERSSTSNDSENVSLRNRPAGTYFLKVSGFNGASNPAYSLRLNTPFVDGPADRFEVNNTRPTATNLGAIEGAKDYPDLSINSSTDTDFYRFETKVSGKSGDEVRIRFSHALGDLDLRLFNSAGDLIGRSETSQDTEVISLTGRPPGEYFVQVVGAENSKNPNYTLHIEASELIIPADRFEPNDTFQTATPLTVPNGVATFQDLNIHLTGNSDWYSFSYVGDATATHFVSANFTHFLGDLDIELYDAQGTKIRASASIRDQELISLAGLPSGTYFLRVLGNSGAVNPNYSLELALPVQNIPADILEPNDSRLTATDLRQVQGDKELLDLTIHTANNDDWFRFETVSTSTSSHFVGLIFDESQGDIDLELFDASGNLLASSSTSNNWEIINLGGKPAGVYYAKVSGYRGGRSPRYSFSIFAPESNIQPDAFESNDTLATASELRTIEGTRSIDDLSIHAAGDFDWFAFSTVAVGTSNNYAAIYFSNAMGDLDLSLWDTSGNLLSQSQGTSDAELINLSGFSAGKYLLRITGANGQTVNADYKLTFDAPTTSIPSDAFEPNDSLVTAYDLRTMEGVSSVTGATVHQAGNDDWYRFEMRAVGQPTHFVEVEFDHKLGDLDFVLYDALGIPIATSATASNTERISLHGQQAGVYFLKVFGFSGATNPEYRLNFSTPIFGDLTPDKEEANDSLANASKLRNLGENLAGSIRVEDLSLHSASDIDFYTFTTVGEGTLANSVSILFNAGDSDFTLELLNASGAILRSSTSLTGTEYISLDGLAAGTYLAKVRGVNGSRGKYSLSVDAPSSNQRDAWTIMVYMTSSDLAQFAFSDINELEQAAANLPGDVNIAILWDQSASANAYATGNSNQPAWTSVGRAFIRPDLDNTTIASSFELMPELNSGSAATLTSFIDWAASEAPAQRYALIGWDHGAGIFGSNFDNADNLPADNLQISEFSSGINASLVKRFDVLAFDACLMSMVEVGYNLQSVTNILVGSQEVVGTNGYNYSTLFSNLVNNPHLVDGEQLASNLVSSYSQEYAGNESGWDTQSAIRTSDLTPLAGALRALTNLAGTLSAAQLASLATILEVSTSYSAPDYRDLGSILTGIVNEATLPQSFRDAAQSVQQAITNSLVALANDARRSSGMSIFVPEGTSLGTFYSAEFATFVAATGWDSFIAKAGGQGNGGTTGSRFGRSVSIQDWAENNDLPAVAENLFRIAGSNVTFNGLSLHDAKDVDWFRFTIAGTGQTNDRVSTTTSGSSALLTEVYNPGGNTLLRSSVGSGDGSVSLTGLNAGEYLLKVSSPTGTVVRKYSIVATAPSVSQPVSRLGDISIQDKAFPVGVVANQVALAGLDVAAGSSNWFAIDTPRLSEERWFSVQISPTSGSSLSARVVNAAGKVISTDQGSGTLVLGYLATGASERYYLHITNAMSAAVAYNVRVDNLVETFSDVLIQERLAGALVDQLPLNEVVSSLGSVTVQDDRFEWVAGGLRLRPGVHLSAVEQMGIFIPIVVNSSSPSTNPPAEFVLPIKVVENTRPYFNAAYPENVNNDSDSSGAPIISPIDALIIINYLNGRSPINIQVRNAGIGVTQHFVDVSGDGLMSPRDALLVINKINQLKANAEGEFTPQNRLDSHSKAVDQVFFSWADSELEQITKRRLWK